MDCFAALAMTTKHGFTTSPRHAPEAAQLAQAVRTNVSRTRCSVLHDAPQSRDLYCHLLPCEVDPGSAAHRYALRRRICRGPAEATAIATSQLLSGDAAAGLKPFCDFCQHADGRLAGHRRLLGLWLHNR